MTDAEYREVERLLEEAAAKVEAATALLDLSTAPCERCGLPLFEFWDEAKVRERIAASPEKLRVAAARLRNTARGPQVCACAGGRPTGRVSGSYYNSE